MKKTLFISFICSLFLISHQVNAQNLLNRIKHKVEDDAVDKIFAGKDKTGADNSKGTAGGNRAANKGGEGLITTPPDVKEHLKEAEASFKNRSYGEARHSIRQAMLGVELEIGKKILLSLPESVNGLNKNDEVEQVASSGWGWSGLTILREYSDKQDKQFRVTVANNALLLSAVNMYLANGGYAQASGEQQNWKQTKVKGHRAVIEYDQSSGYKLSVPLGQTSMVIYEGINFKNEQEIMAAANTIDIDRIMKMLGEK